jgi:riboflavin synthase
MFTGLIIETGECLELSDVGASARLTVVERDGEVFSFDLLAETLRKTSLGALREGSRVNLEPALGAGAKMGGHFVQGHVDTAACVIDFSPHGADYRLEVELPRDFAQYVAYKGSIAVDGISLTVAEVKPESFVCWIIPHTREVTNLAERTPGDVVNLEFDLLAKYVERMIAARLPATPAA